MVQVATGELTRLHFTLFQEDGITPESGKVDGDFDKLLILEDSVDVLSSTVTEVGSTGVYFLEFTPNDEGWWYVKVTCDDVETVHSCWLKVGPIGAPQGYLINEAHMNVAYDESTTIIYMEVWLDRNGQSIPATDLVSCEVKVYDDAGTELFTETSSSPDSNGRFSLSRSGVVLSSNRPYNATVTVVDVTGTVATFQAFTTVG
ncbi:MAG: hypothetical protein ACXADB_13600 [Candidatus Hermodarchaeia archaeon]|jgi:hypothetical protein